MTCCFVAIKAFLGKTGKLVLSAALTDKNGASGIFAKSAIEFVSVISTNHGESPVFLQAVNAELGPPIDKVIKHPLSSKYLELGLMGPDDEAPIKLSHGETHNFKLSIGSLIDDEWWELKKISATDTLGREFLLTEPPLGVLKKHINKFF